MGLVASIITVVTGPAAEAATPPVFPNNIVVFPERDFVVLEGYESKAGQTATIVVTRGGVETSRAVGPVGAGDPSLEVNHPGGVCWQGVTPNIKPGDVVTASFSGGGSDSTTTLSPAVTRFRTVGDFGLVVEGTRGADAPRARMEQRVVNPDMDTTDIGRRDIRAPSRPGPYTSTLEVAPGTFTATYNFVVDANTTAAEATEMRDLAAAGQQRVLAWQATDVDANRQGLTISEFGEVGGPGFGGCPAGPENSAPNAPTNVTATAGDASATATWTESTTVPDGAAVTGYRVTAVNTGNNVETSLTTASAGCTPAGCTVPNLVNGATYRIEVRALSSARPSQAGVAPNTVTPSADEPPPGGAPIAPSSVTAFQGRAGAPITARAQWTAPSQPAGVTVDSWQVNALNATTGALIKSVSVTEPASPTTTTRGTPVRFASITNVYFTVQANDAGSLSAPSPASNTVTTR